MYSVRLLRLGRTGICSLLVLVSVLAMPSPLLAQSETVEYYGLDALGSVRVIFDQQGNLIARMDYDPFGENLRAAIKFPTEQFAQVRRDSESGQDYAQARYYSAGTGRFTRVDTVYSGLFEPQRWNRYSYAFNKPLGFIDPDGKDAKCVWTERRTDDGITGELKCPPPPMVALGTGGREPVIDPNARPEPRIGPAGTRNKARRTTNNNNSSNPGGGVTLVGGVDLNLVLIGGIDANAGGLIGSSGCSGGGIAGGAFAGIGPAVGINMGASAFGGVVFGPTSNVRGDVANVNVTIMGGLNITIMINSSGQLTGFTLGGGIGPPAPVMVSGSITQTTTWVAGECGG